MSAELEFGSDIEIYLNEVHQSMDQLISGNFKQDVVHEYCRYHLSSGGRRIRARLALATAKSLGADPRLAVGWAAACELFHNGTLIHDDIQDGDKIRRGQPAVWAKFGVAQAINAGDLMFLVPIQAFAHTPLSNEIKWQLTQIFSRGAEAVVRGQAAESHLAFDDDYSSLESHFLSVVEGKTSALFSLPIEGAALISGRTSDEAARLAQVTGSIGVLFQICDDMMDFMGRKGRARPCEDLREGKVSALVVQYLQSQSHDEGAQLLSFLKKPRAEVNDAEISLWRDRLERADTITRTRAWAHSLSQDIQSQLATCNEAKFSEIIRSLIAAVLSQVN